MTITAGASRVASGLLCLHAIAITPAGPMELVRSSLSIVGGLPLCNSPVGSCNYCFGTCSAFTHVTACTLAESPCDPFHRKLRQLRCLHCRFDCYRVERTSSRAGVAPAEVQRLSRRTLSTIKAQAPYLENHHAEVGYCEIQRTLTLNALVQLNAVPRYETSSSESLFQRTCAASTERYSPKNTLLDFNP